MIDRLIAALIGALCGLAMAFIWSVVLLRGIGACYATSASVASSLACNLGKVVFWLLLAGPPLVGLVFGFDVLLKWLSKFWGTDKKSGI